MHRAAEEELSDDDEADLDASNKRAKNRENLTPSNPLVAALINDFVCRICS